MADQCPHEWIGPKECIHCGWWPDPADQSRRIIAELAKENRMLRALVRSAYSEGWNDSVDAAHVDDEDLEPTLGWHASDVCETLRGME
jgi:hypothetical protein